MNFNHEKLEILAKISKNQWELVSKVSARWGHRYRLFYHRTLSGALGRSNPDALGRVGSNGLTVILNTCKLSTSRRASVTLSLVSHGNSVPGNTAMDICVLKKSFDLITAFV